MEPRSIEELERATTLLCDQAIRDGLVAKVAAELPGLLDELIVIIAATDDDRAWRTLAYAYRCVRHVVLNWGFRDLADIALDRATWAAVNGGDPLAEAVRNRARASNHLRAGSYESGRELLRATLRLVEDAPPGPRQDVLAGHTHLGWAVNAARSGDDAAVQEHLDVAESIAQRTGDVPTLDWFGFGPTNVAAHRVATLIEGGYYDRAVEAAASLRIPNDWPATRAAHHLNRHLADDVDADHGMLERRSLPRSSSSRPIAPHGSFARCAPRSRRCGSGNGTCTRTTSSVHRCRPRHV